MGGENRGKEKARLRKGINFYIIVLLCLEMFYFYIDATLLHICCQHSKYFLYLLQDKDFCINVGFV